MGVTSTITKEKKDRHNCCVPQCSAVKIVGNHLHTIPKDDAMRKLWAIAIKTGKPLSSTMQVCSRYFKEEDYINSGAKLRRTLKKCAVPTQNLPIRPHDKIPSSPMKRKAAARTDRARKRALRIDEPSPSADNLVKGVSESETCEDNSDGGGDVVPDNANQGEVAIENSEEAKRRDFGTQTDPVASEGLDVFSSFLKCDKKLFSITGLHSVNLLKSLTACYNKVAPDSQFKNCSLCIRDRIILTMMKIRLAVSFFALAALAGICVQTCSNYFYDTVIILAKILKVMVTWPDKEAVMKNLPRSFDKYKCTRAILDCYEVPIETPKCIRCRVRSYSQYKKSNTAKILMICSPSVLITHTCAAFGGRASDKIVTKHSGIYELCDPTDGLMVDKGFNIDQECQESMITLIRPPFMRQKTKFSKAESVECAKIARARVHVERVIQRVREYRILKFRVPWKICPYLDDLVIIVSALVNLGKPIMAKDKY